MSAAEFVLDGVEFVWRTVGDDSSSIFDEDECCHGKLEWVRRFGDYGNAGRPDGFDGNAEILERDDRSNLWWQPRIDGPKRGSDEFRMERRQVRDLIEYGYVGVVVECVANGDTESLWGVEATGYEYHEQVARECAGELVSRLRGLVAAF